MDIDHEAAAQRLLDAQVEFLLAEVSGERLAEVVSRDIDDLLRIAETMTLSRLVDREQVKATLRTVVETNGDSPFIDDLLKAGASALYTLAANDEHRIGEVIDREHVATLVGMVLSMHDLRDRILERLAESPLVAEVASAFVSRFLAEFFKHSRLRAERLPGMASLLAMGDRVRTSSDRQFTTVLGDVAGRGAQFTLRRLSNAIKGTMNDSPLFDAAMEVWDLYGAEPIGELRNYLTEKDLLALAELGNQAWLTIRETEYFLALLDGAVDVSLDALGDVPIGTLLSELGIGRDELFTEVMRHAPRVIDALEENGVLARLIRERLEPFFTPDTVRNALTGTAADLPPSDSV